MEEKTYYEQNKEIMKIQHMEYRKNNKEKIIIKQQEYRQHYNKLNYYCKQCKRILLLTSKKRHNQRKHDPKITMLWVE
tara:strand:+ start:44 stop:277 length:234 start_codon:yes stop_codon:yes gene_type:complete